MPGTILLAGDRKKPRLDEMTLLSVHGRGDRAPRAEVRDGRITEKKNSARSGTFSLSSLISFLCSDHGLLIHRVRRSLPSVVLLRLREQ